MMLTRQEFQMALSVRGLHPLAVAAHRNDPSVLTVYLHGPAGDWVHGEALDVVKSVEGVAAAHEDVRTPTIILVRLSP